MDNLITMLIIMYIIDSFIKLSTIDIRIHSGKSGGEAKDPPPKNDNYWIKMLILVLALSLPADALSNIANFFQNTLV